VSRGEQKSSASAARVAVEAENHCAAAFGRDRIEITAVEGATTIRRKSIGTEPLLMLVVNGRGDVSILLDNFDYDDDWRSAIDTLGSPRIADVHETEAGVHCFILDGPGGTALFTAVDERPITDADTEGWLRSLPGWPTAV
jgi:hypothetical protein